MVNKMEQKTYWNIYKSIVLVFVLMSIIGGQVIGQVNIDFERDMCENLDLKTYDFDLNVDVSAATAKYCYVVNNYELYSLEQKAGPTLGLLVMSAMLSFLLYMLMDTKKYDWCN